MAAGRRQLSRYLFDKGWISARIVVPGGALFVAALLFAPGVWTTNIWIGLTLLTFGAAALAAANPPIDAARLDIMHPRLWGRAESGRMALRGLLEGGAPMLFGAVADWLGGGNTGLMWTFLLMLIPVLIASSLVIPARLSYPRDAATAEASAEVESKRNE